MLVASSTALALTLGLQSSTASRPLPPSTTPLALGAERGVEPGPGDPLTVLDALKLDQDAFGGVDLVSPDFQFGFSAAPLGDLNGDGFEDVAVGVPFDGGFFVGRLWILFLDGDGKLLEAVSHPSPDPGGRFGYAVANIGDINRDGTVDLAVTEPAHGGGSTEGALWILNLEPDGSIAGQTLTLAPDFPGPVGPLEGFTESVASLGDLDGDGVTDLALGSPDGDFLSENYGHVWIAFMRANGTVREAVKVGDGLAGLTAPLVSNGGFGYSLAGLGDLDGDGVEDLAVGAPGRTSTLTDNRAWILFLNADGTVKAHQEIGVGVGGFTGPVASNARFGASLAATETAGGTTRLLVGASGVSPGTSTTEGTVWLLDLASDGTVTAQSVIEDGSGGFEGPVAALEQFGASIAVVRGPEPDGSMRLAIGATADTQGGTNSGALWILDLDGADQVVAEKKLADQFGGPLLESELGSSIALLEDLDGDGIRELAVGAPRDQSQGSPLAGTGAVFIVFPDEDGGIRAFTKITEGLSGLATTWSFTEAFGRGVASLGDLDGDGTGDLAVGLPHTGFTQSGRVVILFLNPDGTVRDEQQIGAGLGGFLGPLDDHDRFGWSVANLGDVDGDGLLDLAVGAHGSVSNGVGPAIWILELLPDGTVADQTRLAPGVNGVPARIAIGSRFGEGLAPLGDFDGDGTPDLLAGAPGTDGENGAAYVMLLDPDGSVRSSVEIGPGSGGFSGEFLEPAWFGAGLCAAGDLDGDGVTDLAVGAPLTDYDPTSFVFNGGALWLLLMNPDGTVREDARIDGENTRVLGLDHPDRFGDAVTPIGDRDGDGVPDLAVGGPFEGTSFSNQVGAVWHVSLGGVARVDFETGPDLTTPLVNGAEVSSAKGFDVGVVIDGSPVSNLTAAVFDSDPDGPNAASQDPDLLVDRGNVLILQLLPMQFEEGVYAQPNDDAGGGTFELTFDGREVAPLSIDLIDLCPSDALPTRVTLTDARGRARTYSAPPGWTEDVAVHGGAGYRTLDLTTLDPQPGFLAVATATEDPEFDGRAVVRLEIELFGSGAIDDLLYDPYP